MTWISCDRCWGEGEISVCCDDLCQEECIHGDGMDTCPACYGSGKIRVGEEEGDEP